MRILAALVLLACSSSFAGMDASKANIQPTDAQRLALKEVPGTVQNMNYAFDIQTEAGKLMYVVVNGSTGEIVSSEAETKPDLEKHKKRPHIRHQVTQD